MKPLASHVIRDHIAIGGIVTFLLIPIFGIWNSVVFWLASVLFDVDHYFKFLCLTRFKVFDLRRMQQFFEITFKHREHPNFLAIEVFHTLEFLFLFVVIVVLLVPGLSPIMWGFVFHILVDVVHLVRHILSEGGNPDVVLLRALKAIGLPTKS